MKILVIEDDKQQAANLCELLENLEHAARYCTDPLEALKAVENETPDLVISDLRMPNMDGLTVLKKLLALRPELRVIMLTAFGTIETAVESMKRGAFDFLVKPIEEEKLKSALKMVEDATRFSQMASLSAPTGPENDEFLAVSPTMRKMKDLIRRVASLTTTVLIQGETGTGKELVARAIHFNSPRKDKPFVAVNCANLVENLLESELFGHEKGAFTGADNRKLGKFEVASGGTLFLDEVGEIPLELQAKLLRAIQEQEIERVGGTKAIRVDVRLVSATNKDLARFVEAGAFRKDLFYRLNVFPLKLPPLRERHEEIPVLVSHILQELIQMHGRANLTIADEAISWLKQQSWPGNIRELRNVLERAAIIDEDGVLTIPDLAVHSGAGDEDPQIKPEGSLNAILEDQERQTLIKTLEKFRGNVVAVAKDLGVPRRTLYDKLKKMGIEPAKFRGLD